MIQKNPEIKWAKRSLEFETRCFKSETRRLVNSPANEIPYNEDTYRIIIVAEYSIVYARGKRIIDTYAKNLKREASDFLRAASDFERQFRKFQPDFVLE